MRHHRHLLALILAVICFASAPSGLMQQAVPSADAALKGVKDKFAPDTRVAVFDVTAERRGETVVLKGDVGDPAAKSAALAAVAAAGHADIVDQINVLPDPALGAEAWGVVTVSVAHVRGRPSHPAEQVTEVPMGAVVKLLKRQGGWYYAQTETENYLGFFEGDHVAAMSRAAVDAWTRAPRLMTTALFALVRERPAADALPVCDVVAGSVLKAGPSQGGWIAVELPDGRKGFVEQAYVQDYDAWRQARRLTPETIEKTALQFVGVPYLWGGTSPKGFDCSGLTKTVYRLNGVEIARDADQQADQGRDVPIEKDLSQLKKGDLLFFCPSAARRDRISHVGIYLGDGVFIHCSGLVKRNSLFAGSPIYSDNLLKRLVRARRFVTDTAIP
ncbi:MAG: C40 family peptidase [Acidobacteria bacterium]|nr:C40 family peptidase [Acidobacteriota bacterium]